VLPRYAIIAGAIIIIATLAADATLARQRFPPSGQSREPLPAGRHIVAKDGDYIVVDADARVRFVRQRHAVIRAIFNPADRWLIVLADDIPRGGNPDGRVDFTYNWRGLEGTWPLPERWEGNAVIEEYSVPGHGPSSLGLVLPGGRVQFLNRMTQDLFADPAALAVLQHTGAGSSMGSGGPFDAAERHAVSELIQNLRNGTNITTTQGTRSELTAGAVLQGQPTTYTTMTPGPASGGPVRVGGNIRPPQKTHDVAAVYPEALRSSGVSGVVILELTIGTDGSVSEARVLRGIHEALDQAALDAARQWRYEPTLLSGSPVPVRLTATVQLRQ